MKRFFVAHDFAQIGKDFELTGDEHHHISNVGRAKVGENIIACCGDEFNYYYQIMKISKNCTSLKFLNQELNKSNPHVGLTVFAANIKPDNMAFMVQKLNEIGAGNLVIFSSANCNVKGVNIDKLCTIAIQSCKQCGRSIPLIIDGVVSFEEMAGQCSAFDKVFFADECEDMVMLSGQTFTNSKTALIIGPEGGFIKTERDILRNMSNVIPISLGRRILRAETAAIVGATLLLSKMGEI